MRYYLALIRAVLVAANVQKHYIVHYYYMFKCFKNVLLSSYRQNLGLSFCQSFQYVFGRLLEKGMERLFDYLDIKTPDRGKHRLYHHGTYFFRPNDPAKFSRLHPQSADCIFNSAVLKIQIVDAV